MKVDLKAMTRKELDKLSADIDKQLARIVAKEKKLALAAAEKAVKAHGFSLAEVTRTAAAANVTMKTPAKPKLRGKPKFANPDNKSQTWTGKGRRPDWFLKAMDAGKTPEQLAL